MNHLNNLLSQEIPPLYIFNKNGLKFSIHCLPYSPFALGLFLIFESPQENKQQNIHVCMCQSSHYMRGKRFSPCTTLNSQTFGCNAFSWLLACVSCWHSTTKHISFFSFHICASLYVEIYNTFFLFPFLLSHSILSTLPCLFLIISLFSASPICNKQIIPSINDNPRNLETFKMFTSFILKFF